MFAVIAAVLLVIAAICHGAHIGYVLILVLVAGAFVALHFAFPVYPWRHAAGAPPAA